MDVGFKIGGPPTDLSPIKKAVVEEEQETPEVESTESPSEVGKSDEVSDAPVDAPKVSTPPAPKDSDQTVKSFSFAGPVASLNLPSMATATKEEAISFFTANQDETPTSISLAGNTVVFTYGDKSLKLDVGTLEKMLKKGDVAGDSRLVQSLIVAQTVGELGLPSSQAREITRRFVADMKAGQSPEQARVNAYTSTVSAISLGPDPKAQLEKDMKTVDTFFKNFENPKLAKTLGPVPSPAVKQELYDLMAKRMNAIANNDFAKAFDLQEQAALLAKKHGLPKLGAEPQAIKEPSNRIAMAADEHQSPESDLTSTLLDMLPGESQEWASDGEGGVTVGIGVGYKAPVVDVEVASVKAEATARVLGKSKGSIERESTGDFVLTTKRYIAGGLKGNVSATAMVELAGGSGGADLGHFKMEKLRFATARDLAKYLEAQELEDPTEVKHQPTKTEDAKPTDRPKPGKFVLVEESSGLGTRTETSVRRLGLRWGSEKASALGGGIWNAIRRFLPNITNQTSLTETTRYKTTDGNKVSERSYTSKSEAGNTLLKIFTLGIVGRVTTRNQIDLKLRTVAPPSLPKGVQGPSLATAFKPSLGIQIDSGKVQACKSEQAVEMLIQKEFTRVLDLAKACNKDAKGDNGGKDVLNLNEDGQTYLKESIRKAFMLIYNEANRTPKGDERKMVTDSDTIATDVGFKVSKTSLSGGWTSGGMVTLKIPFKDSPDGFQADVGNTEVGLNSTTAARFSVGIGVDSHDIPGSPVKVSVAVYGKTSASSGGYTQLIGKSTVKPTVKPV